MKKFVDFYKIGVSDILVIQDDLDMPLGNIKLMCNRGDGGHNGIKDISLKLGSKNYLRVKIGIGKSDFMDTKDYVLGKFSNGDRDLLKDAFCNLRNIVSDFNSLNIDGLMQKYNTKIQK